MRREATDKTTLQCIIMNKVFVCTIHICLFKHIVNEAEFSKISFGSSPIPSGLRLKSQVHLEPCQISKIGHFVKVVRGF